MVRSGSAEQFRRYCSLIKLKHWLHVNEMMIIEIILMTCCTNNLGRKNVKNYRLHLKAQKQRNLVQIWYTNTVCKQIKTRQEWVTSIPNLGARIDFVLTFIKSDVKTWSFFCIYLAAETHYLVWSLVVTKDIKYMCKGVRFPVPKEIFSSLLVGKWIFLRWPEINHIVPYAW